MLCSIVLVVLLGGCSSGSSSSSRSTTTVLISIAVDVPFAGPGRHAGSHLRGAAVSALLGRRTAGRSRRLLSTAVEPGPSHLPLTNAAGLAAEASCPLSPASRCKEPVATPSPPRCVYRPGLDVVIGLSAARERQTWHGRRAGAGWLVDGDPEAVYAAISMDAAVTAALQWSRCRAGLRPAAGHVPTSGGRALRIERRGSEALPVDRADHRRPLVVRWRPARRRPTSSRIQHRCPGMGPHGSGERAGGPVHGGLAPIGDVWKLSACRTDPFCRSVIRRRSLLRITK